MSLTELVLVVGLWALWLGALLILLHALGREVDGPAETRLLSSSRGRRQHWS